MSSTPNYVYIDGQKIVATDNGDGTKTLAVSTGGGQSATIKTLNTQVLGTDNAEVTASVMHGRSTAGGGGFVDVKVTPDGKMTVDTGLVQGLTDTQLRAAAVAIIAASLPLPAGAATSSLQTTGNTSLSSLDTKIPAQQILGMMPVDTLATPISMIPHAVTATSTSVALTSTTRRVSIDVSVSAIVRINATASLPANGTALANAIAIPANSTKDFDVPASTTLHFIRDGSSDGTIRITELS